eukprot:7389993-Prymnesium_polylepis.1
MDGLLRPRFDCLPLEPPSPVPTHAGSPRVASADGAGLGSIADGVGGGADAGSGAASVDLVVLILSSRHRELGPSKRRAAVRRAWAHASSLGPLADDDSVGVGAPADCAVRFLFVMGGGRRAHLWQGDVLVLPVADGYRQITQKVLVAFEWVAQNMAFKYLLKTDDDSFVCLARLLDLLLPLPRAALYLGVVNRDHAVVTSGRHRWADREYAQLFNRTVYPPYMQGAGYVLSADLVNASV